MFIPSLQSFCMNVIVKNLELFEGECNVPPILIDQILKNADLKGALNIKTLPFFLKVSFRSFLRFFLTNF